ncbi:MAG: hypothetical protein ACK4N4_14370 [Burkholderiales bacterium]
MKHVLCCHDLGSGRGTFCGQYRKRGTGSGKAIKKNIKNQTLSSKTGADSAGRLGPVRDTPRIALRVTADFCS